MKFSRLAKKGFFKIWNNFPHFQVPKKNNFIKKSERQEKPQKSSFLYVSAIKAIPPPPPSWINGSRNFFIRIKLLFVKKKSEWQALYH